MGTKLEAFLLTFSGIRFSQNNDIIGQFKVTKLIFVLFWDCFPQFDIKRTLVQSLFMHTYVYDLKVEFGTKLDAMMESSIHNYHLHEIVEGLFFHYSLSVCLSGSACQLNSSWTNEPIWTRFSLNGCLPHYFVCICV